MEKIKQLITSTPIKLQISLDEDSTDQQVLNQLDDALRIFAIHENDGTPIKWVVGRLLIIVRERKLWAVENDTFEEWLNVKVLSKYGLSRSSVLSAVPVLEVIPDAAKQKAPFANLALVARAIKHVPEARKEAVFAELLKDAKREKTVDFKEQVEKKFKLRRHTGRTSTITFRVTSGLAEAWRRFIGDRASAEVLAELIGYGRKMPQSAARARQAS